MAIQNKQVIISGPKADVRPLLVRIGGPDVEEFECPEYPKWVDGESGKVLVNDADEEKSVAVVPQKTLTLKPKE